jgi:uncharacterized membrane protein
VRAITFMLVFLSATLYGFALTQPAFMSGEHEYSGWDCLTSGMFEIAAWFANPVLLIAWIVLLLRHWSGALIAAGALAAAISFTGLTPSRGELGELRAGYWLWMASIFVALITGFVVAIESIVEASRRSREGETA